MPLCCALLIAIAEAACGSSQPPDSRPVSDVSPLASVAPAVTGAPAAPGAGGLAAQISAEIGDAACDNAQQCRTLAYGHKACGGPERYLAYSTKRSDSARLAQLGEQLARQRRDEDVRSGMMSTCSVTPDPGATCTAGRCVLQPQGPGGPAVR